MDNQIEINIDGWFCCFHRRHETECLAIFQTEYAAREWIKTTPHPNEDEWQVLQCRKIEPAEKEAIEILSSLRQHIIDYGQFDVDDTPTENSKAGHGCAILYNAIQYLKGEPLNYDFYKPYYTRPLTQYVKPSLGVYPKKFWLEDRRTALMEAIERNFQSANDQTKFRKYHDEILKIDAQLERFVGLEECETVSA